MNRVAFSIFNINIYYYSIFILLGIVISYFIITRESKRQDIKEEYILNLLFYGILVGILGARIYYVIFNLSYYLNNPLEIFAIRNGGLAIHGGIIFGLTFIYFYTKKYHYYFLKITDILTPGLIIAQSIGRWGNFFNQEAHGGIVKLSILKSMHIPKFIIDGMYINGNYYYPTFFFESILCLLGFIILIIIRKNKNTKIGTITSIYFIWYGLIRFFIESLRTDSLMLFNLKMAQIVSLISVVVGIVLFIKSNKNNDYYRKEV